jgi:hypothetical protein
MMRWWVGLVALLTLGGEGCATLASRHKDEAPKALQQYRSELLRLDTAQFVKVPPALAWNTTVERLRRAIPIESSDFDSRVVQTHWLYMNPVVRDGVAAQKRERFKVVLRGEDAASYGVHVQATAEVRQRTTCTPPGPWLEASASAKPVGEALDKSLRALGKVPPEQLQFPGSPPELLTVLQDVVARRWGLAPMPEGLKFPIRGSWREKIVDLKDMRLELRSTVVVGAAGGEGSTRLLADAMLQHRAVNKEGATLWIEADAAPVREDFYARVVQLISPLTIERPSGEPVAVSDPEPPEVDLPRPADPLRGTYGLFVRAVIAPRKKPNGLDWDPGSITQELIRNAQKIARYAALVPEPNVQAVARFVKSVPPEVFERAAQLVGQFTAPDIQVVFSIPGLGVIATPVAEDTYVASWQNPIEFNVNGDGVIQFHVWDIDLIENDSMGSGSFTLEELANACEPVCKGNGATGGAICLELRRARQQ